MIFLLRTWYHDIVASKSSGVQSLWVRGSGEEILSSENQPLPSGQTLLNAINNIDNWNLLPGLKVLDPIEVVELGGEPVVPTDAVISENNIVWRENTTYLLYKGQRTYYIKDYCLPVTE